MSANDWRIERDESGNITGAYMIEDRGEGWVTRCEADRDLVDALRLAAEEERRQITQWLRAHLFDETAELFERGEHWRALPEQEKDGER